MLSLNSNPDLNDEFRQRIQFTGVGDRNGLERIFIRLSMEDFGNDSFEAAEIIEAAGIALNNYRAQPPTFDQSHDVRRSMLKEEHKRNIDSRAQQIRSSLPSIR